MINELSDLWCYNFFLLLTIGCCLLVLVLVLVLACWAVDLLLILVPGGVVTYFKLLVESW
jgi:hypothetical protein